MRLEKKPRKYDEGAFGTVFFINDEFAVKVFRRKESRTEDFARKVMQSEVSAHEAIQNNTTFLKELTPKYYGQVTIETIFDENGQDISNDFFLNLAYKMEYLQGRFMKNPNLYQNACVSEEFKRLNIKFIADCSCIENNGQIEKIIDFAMVNFVEFYN